MTGPELYERRKKKGWTQAKLGAALSVDVSTIRAWENGKRPIREALAKLIHFTLTRGETTP